MKRSSLDFPKLYEYYKANPVSVTTLARQIGCDPQTLLRGLKEVGLKRFLPVKGRGLSIFTKEHMQLAISNWKENKKVPGFWNNYRYAGFNKDVVKNWLRFYGLEIPSKKTQKETLCSRGYCFVPGEKNPIDNRTLQLSWKVLRDAYNIDLSSMSGYVVHHMNEDTSDNSIENLRLLTRGEHLRLHRHPKFLFKKLSLSPGEYADTCHAQNVKALSL